MPYYKKHTKRYLSGVLKKLKEERYTKIAQLTATAWKTDEPVNFTERKSGEKREIAIGEKWGDLWDCAWFNFTGKVPVEATGKQVVLLIDLSGEGCVFDDNGLPIRGLTTVSSTFALELGEPGKTVVQFLNEAQGGEEIDIWVDAGNNDLFGEFQGNGSLTEASIAICNQEIRQLYYDFLILHELMENIPEEKARYHSIMETLNQAANVLNNFNEAEAKKARAIIKPELDKKGGDPSLTVSAIGHAHIDLAWLWPIRETIRKGARTFSTVLELMDRYPDYNFGASQPQLYQWMKDHYPKLYDRIKARIDEGRWEAQGAMWVEADTNVSGGEALVRQLLYGKRYFRQEFNQDMEVLWLPDVFGYSAALPQLLKKSGVDYFMTQKLSWNEHNQFPHHTFHWEGIDGSKVLTHMLPEETYNSPGSPRAVLKAESNFQEKGISDRCLMLFGIGDGGGGPGAEHLEALKREHNLAGMPPVEQEPSIDFFKKIGKDQAQYKTWSGELYLERHQGTFTTQARNKWYNRKMEFALRELEFAAAIAMTNSNYEYPQEQVEGIWKEVLLYQFHDILPGSSIKRVYDESLDRYEKLYTEVKALTEKAYNSLIIEKSESEKYVLFNSLSWPRQEWVKLNNSWYNLDIKAMGYTQIDKSTETDIDIEIKATNNTLENDLLEITFNQDGTISSIYDKENRREAIAEAESANQLSVYQDYGDAWDIPIFYEEKKPEKFKLESVESKVDGPEAMIKQVYRYGKSRLVQEIILTDGSRRVDFKTEVDWQEQHKMLRTSFPVNVFAREASCEIQFGNIKRPTHRNTSWDMAKFEIPAQKWVDLSQPDYGVALLNDCKYGYKAKDNILDLDLLRSPDYPGKAADRAVHHFVYSLYPHSGDHIEGNVARAAYELNIPLQIMSGEIKPEMNNIKPLLKVDSTNIIIEAVKKAEDDDSIIVRLYENSGIKTNCQLELVEKITAVELTNLLEEVERKIQLDDSNFNLSFTPFEIKTLKFTF